MENREEINIKNIPNIWQYLTGFVKEIIEK